MDSSKKEYDVVVIGLGAMGSAALYQLSKQGLSVLGIDQFDPPHSFGSSYGESRITRQAIGEGVYYTPLVLRANQIWKELEKTTGESLYEHNGMLLLAGRDREFLQNTLKAADKFSIEHKLLGTGEVEELFPAIKAVDSDLVYYYEPDAGYLLPEKCIEVQLRLAKNNNASVLTNTKVHEINETVDGITVNIGTEVIACKKVIVTAGPWIKNLLPNELDDALKTSLRTLFWFDIDKDHYDELKPGKLPVILCDDEEYDFYGFPALAGENGGMKFAVHELGREIEPDEKDAADVEEGLSDKLYQYLSKYIKYVKPEVIKSFNCIYTETHDEDFIIDFKPNSKNIIMASACSGHGFKHSAAIGEILAQLAVNGNSDIDITAFRLNRFK